MVELKIFIGEISGVYAAIAKRIEELLEALNSKNEADPHTQALAQRITNFLKGLEKSVNAVKRSAKTLPPQTKARLLALLQKEIKEIRQLESYVALAKKHPKPAIITSIHSLYRELKTTMEREEAMMK